MSYKKKNFILLIIFFILTFPNITRSEDSTEPNKWAKSFAEDRLS